MITLFALMMASKFPPVITPSYEVSKCYEAASEFRPRLIRITEIGKQYGYIIWLEGRWSYQMENSFKTIEFVYKKEVKCP